MEIITQGQHHDFEWTKAAMDDPPHHVLGGQPSQSTYSIGQLIGVGTFSKVYSVNVCASSNNTLIYGAEGPTEAKTVAKMLRTDMLNHHDELLIQEAIKDIVIEAKILSQLPKHPNVVMFYGVSDNFWTQPQSGYILMESLHETLQDRLNRLSIHNARFTADSKMHSSLAFFKSRKPDISSQRARIASYGLQIANALKFLHKHEVVYRDLKPCNIGLDEDDRIRIFDFGLARYRNLNTERRLTSNAGTPRYMAPECASGQDYSFPVDVYSFAIMLWEICTLERPFGMTTLSKLRQQTIHKHLRPPLAKIGSLRVRELLKAAWHPQPEARPSFSLIAHQLGEEVRA